MSRKIIGVTVGTPISAESIKQNIKPEINADIDKLRADLELEEVARADMDNLIMNTWVVPIFNQLQTLQNWTAEQISTEQNRRADADAALHTRIAKADYIRDYSYIAGERIYRPSLGLEIVNEYTVNRISHIGSCTDTEVVFPKTAMTNEGSLVPVNGMSQNGFIGNGRITSVVIPENYEEITEFKNCPILTRVIILNENLPPIKPNAIPSTVKQIYIPAHKVAEAKTYEDYAPYADKIVALETLKSVAVSINELKAILNGFIDVSEVGA